MRKGFKMSEEQKKKIGLANKGKVRSMQFREMRRRHATGKRQSLEQIERRAAKLRGKKRTPEQILRMIQGRKPKLIYKSSLRQKIYNSIEYKLWRKSVFERDGYQCIWGGKEHGDRLQADHIKSFAFFPELRFAIDNGRTLCIDCHRKTDTWGQRATNKHKGMESKY